MFKFAIEKPVIVSVAMAIVCLFGVLAIYRVPIQMIPDLDPRMVSVRTTWVGATPQDVEQEILTEQEKFLARIPGLERMMSWASTGSARVQLEFPHGTEISEALIRVSNALSRVSRYPENVVEPVISANSFSSSPFMFFRIMPLDPNMRNEDMVQMRDFVVDHIGSQIERVPGVAAVSVWGGAERQVKISVNPGKLAERGLTVLDVRNSIRARNRDVSGGDMNSGKRRYLLRTIGRFESVKDIEQLVISKSGQSLIRLKDVGTAELSNLEVRYYSYANGRPNITMGIRRQVGSNVVEVMDGIMARVADLNQGLLAHNGLEMELTSEDVQYVKDAVHVVRRNLIIGGVLATLVLLLFLRSMSATLVGAIGIPVCTIAAFLGLLLAGRTINVISLAGVAFAIGMTIDNSIVVLESIYRHMTQGKARRQAALDGVREVWTAVLASTLTTVFVFLPVIFITEEAGQLYSDIAVAVSASILLSMVVAITVIPAACSRFLNPPVSSASRYNIFQSIGKGITIVVLGFVKWLLNGVLRRLILIIGIFGAALIVIQQLTPKAEYLPEGEEQKLFANMYAPPGYNVETMHQIYKQFDPQFIAQVGADPQKFADGETSIPPLNFVVGYAGAESITYIPEATDRAQVESLVEVVTEKMKPYPGVRSFVSRGSIFQGNRGGSRSINLDISAPDLETLFEVGNKAYERAKQIFDNPQVRLQPSSLSMDQPLIEIRPDWERAAELGISADSLGYTVSAYSDGAYVDEFFLDDSQINMYLYSTDGIIQRPEDLDNLPLYTVDGGIVPLSSVARVIETVNTASIRRVDGSRTITLSIIPPKDIALEVGVEKVKRELVDSLRNSGDLSDQVHMRISGASDRLNATRDALTNNFIIAILVSYLLMVAIFSHWGFPMLIMATVPVGISGGIIGLWALNKLGANLSQFGLANFHQPFDMITMLGFLVLIGTVVNNPILIVERSLTNIRNGLTALDAVMESVKTRLRPIMMSTVTTICGLSPLVFYPGAGTELYRGLGAIVLFGLLFSTLVTLTFMPAALSLILQISESWKSRRSSHTQEPVHSSH
jgi:multidrug efflux pump subunit AcrB